MAQHDGSSDACQAFHIWRKSTEAQLPGLGGPACETIRKFIPRSNLEKYFERGHQLKNLLDAVLDSDKRTAVDVAYVRHHYLQTFATLLCIGRGHLIYHFQQHRSLRDQKLPYRTRPDRFPFTTPDMFEAFRSEQWQFCASKLEYAMTDRFNEEDILPIILKEKIGEGGSAIINKIVLEDSYNSLRPPGGAKRDHPPQYQNTFVLKTYRAAEAEESYTAERDAYMKLRWGGNPSQNIVSCYGGFVHGNSYNVILEYADEGTLEDFMKKTDPPSSFEDTLRFWNRILGVLHGIMAIHGQIRNEDSASQIFNGVHQDIKPANILVFGGNESSPYDCQFKIADLGLTSFKPVSQQNDPSDLDAFGTRAYGAPETFRSHVDAESAPLRITQAVDIYSIGCVLSEVSVWATYGWKRVVEYRRRRSMEVERRGLGQGEYIFHFDGEILDTVDNIHEQILDDCIVSNHMTRLVVGGLVEEMLLLQPEARSQAGVFFGKAKRMIKQCGKKFGARLEGNTNGEPIDEARLRAKCRDPVLPEFPCSPSQSGGHNSLPAERGPPLSGPIPPDDDSSRSESLPSRHHHHSKSQRKERHSVVAATEPLQPSEESSHVVPNPTPAPSTTANAHESSEQQHAQQRQEEPVQPTLTIEEGLHWKALKKRGKKVDLPGGENLTSLDQRDHIFLIDNSATMKQYQENIEEVVSLLAYMLKPSDKDGLDLYFTQDLQKVNSKKSSKLSRSIHNMHFSGISDMRGKLHNILQEHRNKSGVHVSFLKTLLGRQSQQSQRRLSFYILTDAKWQPNNDVGGRIRDLVRTMRHKGHSKEYVAIQFIRFGDDPASIDKLDRLDHGLGLKAIGMDIVDHTYWKGNVWKQLLGALNDWYDDDPS